MDGPQHCKKYGANLDICSLSLFLLQPQTHFFEIQCTFSPSAIQKRTLVLTNMIHFFNVIFLFFSRILYSQSLSVCKTLLALFSCSKTACTHSTLCVKNPVKEQEDCIKEMDHISQNECPFFNCAQVNLHWISKKCFCGCSKQVINPADFATLKIWVQSDHWFKSYDQKVNFQSTKS